MEVLKEKYTKPKTEHNWFYVSLVLGLVGLYTIMVGFNVLASLGSAYPLFKSNVGNVSDLYPVEVTPAGWVFSIVWTVIFVWQYIWLIYAFICLFRKTESGELLYRSQNFMNYGILIAFAVNNAVIIAWLFLWDNFIFGWALLMISVSAISLHVCLFISFRKCYQLNKVMYKKDIWINRILVQNGLGFFLTWLSLATNLNFAIFLTYGASVAVDISSTAVLIIILALIVTYFVLENFVWQRYMMYLFAPWFVLNLALIGSISKNYNGTTPSRNNILTVVLLILVVIFTIVKICMVVLYHTKLSHRVHRVVCKKASVEDQAE